MVSGVSPSTKLGILCVKIHLILSGGSYTSKWLDGTPDWMSNYLCKRIWIDSSVLKLEI